MESNPVGWFEIYVKDMDRAKKFYEAVLDVILTKLESPGSGLLEMWTFPMHQNQPGATGALARMEEDGPIGNGTIVYFTCENCAEEASRVSSNGGKVMKEKFSIGENGFIAIVTDTEGNAVGLHSMK
jgi:uncharacterized protein